MFHGRVPHEEINRAKVLLFLLLTNPPQLFPLDSFTQRAHCYWSHYRPPLLCQALQGSQEMAIDGS